MTTTAKLPDYAGIRQFRRARSTGRMVGVYDGIAAGMDTEAGRWQTVCEDHGSICSHVTLALATSSASAPEEWCEPCMRPEEHDEDGLYIGSPNS